MILIITIIIVLVIAIIVRLNLAAHLPAARLKVMTMSVGLLLQLLRRRSNAASVTAAAASVCMCSLAGNAAQRNDTASRTLLVSHTTSTGSAAQHSALIICGERRSRLQISFSILTHRTNLTNVLSSCRRASCVATLFSHALSFLRWKLRLFSCLTFVWFFLFNLCMSAGKVFCSLYYNFMSAQ